MIYFIAFLLFCACVSLQMQITEMEEKNKNNFGVLANEVNKLKVKTGVD